MKEKAPRPGFTLRGALPTCLGRKWEITMRLTSTLAPMLLAATVAVAPAAPSFADPTPTRLVVTAQGRADVRPDIATISVGVRTEGATAAAALAQNNTLLAAVLDRLRASGIAERDLQTSGLALGPLFEYNNTTGTRKPAGYEANNGLTVRVRDLAKLGTILDLVVADGANTFNGLTFGLAEPTPAEDAALASAVREARRKADLIATAAGLSVGRIVDITEAGYSPPTPRMLARSDVVMEAAVPIAEGEVSYAASVTITYELAP